MKYHHKILSILFTLSLMISIATGRLSAANTVHYLAIASDRHGNTASVYQAMKGMPSSVEYVSLIGDMVGQGGDRAPAYNSSTILEEIMSVGFTKVTDTSHVSMLWADHDAGVIDDANIVFADPEPEEGTAGTTGVMATGLNSDGSIAYYVYGIAFYDMLNVDEASSGIAAFKKWIDTVTDLSIPIIVLCHAPLHYARKDNKGAELWSKALNYAATGKETTEPGLMVTRNIIYMHGHNHTNESKTGSYSGEFYVPCDSEMEVGATADTWTHTYYTYTTAGYLNQNTTATLISINTNDITINKYQKGTVSDDVYDTESKASKAFANTFVTSGTNTIMRSVSNIKAKTYTGKKQTQSPVITLSGHLLKASRDYTLSYKNNVNAGTATLTITLKGQYNGTITTTFIIKKAANTLNAKGKTVILKYKKLKKKNLYVTRKKAIKITKKVGSLTYAKSSGNKKITISKAGKIKVKKGLKKGSYKLKVKVKASGSRNYKAKTKTVTVKIKVK